jgi:putative membrane protein
VTTPPERATLVAGLPDATKLAVERTRLAYERTLMAWVRTSTALISFGFTVYKFFQFLREEGNVGHPQRLFGSREFGLVMLVLGLSALVGATVQHRLNLQRLRAHYVEVPLSLAAALAILVAAFGIVLLLVVIFQQ